MVRKCPYPRSGRALVKSFFPLAMTSTGHFFQILSSPVFLAGIWDYLGYWDNGSGRWNERKSGPYIYIYIYIYIYWTNKSLSVSTSSCSSGFCCSWGFLICGSRHLSLPKIGIRINVSCHRGSRNFSEIKHMKVAHVCNPSKNLAPWEAGIKRITVQGQYRQVVWHTPASK
jgi:hypothetical protein